jgi:hypothetical protein
MLHQDQPITTQNSAPVLPIDPTPIAQSESPTAMILAIAILISLLTSGITGLVQVIMLTRSLGR